MERNKLLVICGPTATGKTALGVRLASLLDGEIVSADSRQVYIGMDIGTGKDIGKSKFKNQKSKLRYHLVDNIKIWMLDVVEPGYRFSVAEYVRLAREVIKDIWGRGKLPIVVGGTGFYIRGLIDEIDTIGIPPDWELRRKLESEDIEALGQKLQKLDLGKWETMNESDRKNKRRLIRAIEVAIKFNPLADGRKLKNPKKLKINSLLILGLEAPLEALYKRIDQRVEERVKEGIEDEIQELIKKGYGWQNSVLGATVGYWEWQSFFEGKTSKEDVIQRWKWKEHDYARRQLTWFKKDKRVNWFDITSQNWQNRLKELVVSWSKKDDQKD